MGGRAVLVGTLLPALLLIGACGGGDPVAESKATLRKAVDLLEKGEVERLYSECCHAYYMDRVRETGLYEKVLAATKEKKEELLKLLKDALDTDPGLVTVMEGDGTWAKFPCGLATVFVGRTNGEFLLSPHGWEFLSRLFMDEGKEMPDWLPNP
jgi:hypothetical protein